LTQVLSGLPDAAKAARRLKETLQAVFEEFYSFDLDHLRKENLGKAVAKFEEMSAITPFVLSYTIQHGLGGHSIPIDYAAMVIMLSTGIASQAEASAGKIPGLERAVPKNKAIEFSALLHEAGVALMMDHKDKKARSLIDAVEKKSSERYDEWEASKKAAIRRVKRRRREEKAAAEQEQEQEQKEPATAKPSKKPAAKSGGTKSAAKATEKVADKTAEKSAATSKTKKTKSARKKSAAASTDSSGSESKKKSAAKKTAASSSTKKTSKKTAAKSGASKKAASTKKSTNRKLSKRKPR
jgi:hypothetical protein